MPGLIHALIQEATFFHSSCPYLSEFILENRSWTPSKTKRTLGKYLTSFSQSLTSAIDHLRSFPYPYDAKPYLEKARIVLKDIIEIIKETKSLEEKLIRLTTVERKFLEKERETA
jgi:hypothetical protein